MAPARKQFFFCHLCELSVIKNKKNFRVQFIDHIAKILQARCKRFSAHMSRARAHALSNYVICYIATGIILQTRGIGGAPQSHLPCLYIRVHWYLLNVILCAHRALNIIDNNPHACEPLRKTMWWREDARARAERGTKLNDIQ